MPGACHAGLEWHREKQLKHAVLRSVAELIYHYSTGGDAQPHKRPFWLCLRQWHHKSGAVHQNGLQMIGFIKAATYTAEH